MTALPPAYRSMSESSFRESFSWWSAVLLFLLPTIPVQAMEPVDTDFLPWLVDIAFSASDVGFVSTKHRFLNEHQFLLKLDRHSRLGREVDATSYTNAFRLSQSSLEELSRGRKGGVIVTSQGTEYQVDSGYCNYEGSKLESFKRARLSHAGRTLPVQLDPCITFSAIEEINGQMWIGTTYAGDHGVGTGQGIVVWSKKSGSVLGTVSALRGAITQVRWDDIGRSIWVTTTERIYQIGTNMRVKTEFFIYHDFDSASGQPIVRIAPAGAKSNPLSVVARMLVVSDKKSFYEVAKDLPAADVCRFSLPDFFMCCNPGGPFGYSPEMNALAPYFVAESKSAKGFWQATWLQAACLFDDPQVYEYVSSSSAVFGDRARTLAASCKRKFEAARNQHQ